MNKEELKEKLANTPINALGEVALKEPKWMEKDGQAFFQIRRQLIANSFNTIELISLDVVGGPLERTRLIKEFSALLGDTNATFSSNEKFHPVDTAIWVLDKTPDIEVESLGSPYDFTD